MAQMSHQIAANQDWLGFRDANIFQCEEFYFGSPKDYTKEPVSAAYRYDLVNLQTGLIFET